MDPNNLCPSIFCAGDNKDCEAIQKSASFTADAHAPGRTTNDEKDD
jgi:hypothetical protein